MSSNSIIASFSEKEGYIPPCLNNQVIQYAVQYLAIVLELLSLSWNKYGEGGHRELIFRRNKHNRRIVKMLPQKRVNIAISFPVYIFCQNHVSFSVTTNMRQLSKLAYPFRVHILSNPSHF